MKKFSARLKSAAESMLSGDSSSSSSNTSSAGLPEKAAGRLEDFKQGGSGHLNFDACQLDDALADAAMKAVRKADLLESVTKLSLGSNALTRLPAEAAQLEYLIELNVSANALKAGAVLRGVLEQCRQLESLDAANNQLDALPDLDAGVVLRLKRLDASNNGQFRLKAAHADALAARLQALLIASNNLGSMPAAVLQLHALRELDLHDNGLADVPDRFSELPMLESLNLSANKLTLCPSTLTHLKKLQLLNLSRNLFSSLSPAFCAALSSSLTSLELAGNRLADCVAAADSALARLTAVELLDLSDNRIEKLSPSFARLTKLRALKLEKNYLSALPAQLVLLQSNLRELDLSANPLRELPPEYGYFSVEYGGLVPRIKLVGVALDPPASRHLAESDRALMRHLKEKARYHPPFRELRLDAAADDDGAATADDDAALASPRRPMASSQPEPLSTRMTSAPQLAKAPTAQRPAAALPPAAARPVVMQPAQLSAIDKTLDSLLDAAAQLDEAAQLEFDYIDAMRPHARNLGQLTREVLGMVRDATNNNETDDVNARALAAGAVRLATAASTAAKATRERAAEANATEISEELTPGQVAMQTSIKALVAEANFCKRALTAARTAARVNSTMSTHVSATPRSAVVSPRAAAAAAPRAAPAAAATPPQRAAVKSEPKPEPKPEPKREPVKAVEQPANDDIEIDEDEWSSLLNMVDESAAVASTPLEEAPPAAAAAVAKTVPPKPSKPVSAPPPAAAAEEPSYDELYGDESKATSTTRSSSSTPHFTIVVCGAGRTGKSALVSRLCNGVFASEYEPTLDKDVYKKRIELDNGPVDLTIVDAAGVDENAEYRDQDYRSADGFVMTFSVVAGETFKELRNVVARQIAAAKGADLLRARKLPLVVVGTHSDRNMGLRAVQRSDASALAKVLGAPYCEVSSLDDTGCAEPFRLLARRLAFGESHEQEQASADAQQVAGMARAQSTREGRRGHHRPTFIAEQPPASAAAPATRSQRLDSQEDAPRRPVGAVAMPGAGGDALAAALARRAGTDGPPAAARTNARTMSMRGPPSQLRGAPASPPTPSRVGAPPRGQSMMGMTSLLARADADVPPFGGVARPRGATGTAPAAAAVALAPVPAGETYGELPLAPAAKQAVALSERAFFRNCSRQEAEAYLQASADGTFLLRPSTQARAKCVLSSRSYAGEIGHALIQESEKGFHLETVAGYFTSIDELLRSLPIDHDLID